MVVVNKKRWTTTTKYMKKTETKHCRKLIVGQRELIASNSMLTSSPTTESDRGKARPTTTVRKKEAFEDEEEETNE